VSCIKCKSHFYKYFSRCPDICIKKSLCFLTLKHILWYDFYIVMQKQMTVQCESKKRHPAHVDNFAKIKPFLKIFENQFIFCKVINMSRVSCFFDLGCIYCLNLGKFRHPSPVFCRGCQKVHGSVMFCYCSDSYAWLVINPMVNSEA